jgi:hypothetical protein
VIDAVPFQNPAAKVALQRSELQTIKAVSLQKELHGTIAKTADTVIKNDCFRFRFTHSTTSSLAE